MNRGGMLAILSLVLWNSGCVSFQTCSPGPEASTPESSEKKQAQKQKTLLEWTHQKKDEKAKDAGKGEKTSEKEKNGKDANKGGNGKEKDGQKNGRDSDVDKKSGEVSTGDKEKKEEEEEPKRIDTDRPHLPEASTTVGLGRAVLESGYTYNTSGGFFPLHSFPESLLRVGIFADWFEFRIAQNVVNQTVFNEFGVGSNSTGAQDLEIGGKFALTEQADFLPESALILQMSVPSGSKGFTANRVLPGIHYDCSWEIIKDLLSVETVVFADGAVDDHRHTFTFMGDGVTAAYNVTKKLEAFGELDSYYAVGDSAAPQHYFVAGLVYFITPNCEIDVRAGVGLNQHADGYLIGAGFAVRH